ncbi:GntR family transcriptional regulator [Candidatus Rhodobacter oscarellae]|uniref:GntR family transcriptional regulator n=1 Tax=Candidatus Rhodobacter oscarellae TaxID=1675527 RepID=UPI0006716427|nr:GntR family transcriptional regulator [Candidatus Rhodobacter lobularis]
MSKDEAAPGSATQRAYLALRALIVAGEIRPGEKLKIDGLRQRLATGASPIREALSLLTSDNLVERIDQRGFRAAEVSAANFQEILRLRSTLEDQALRESIARGDQAWEEALVLAHHRMQRAQEQGGDGFEPLHKAFHMALLAAAAAPILLKFCSQLYDLNIRYRFLAGRGRDYQSRDVTEEHGAILAAAVDRQADTASALLLAHYTRTGSYLAGLLDDGALG